MYNVPAVLIYDKDCIYIIDTFIKDKIKTFFD